MELLAFGSRGPDVTTVQQALVQQKFLAVPPDGYFGPRTLSAVIDFQKSKGLLPDGIVGPLTWGALAPSASSATPVSTSPSVISTTPVSSTPSAGSGLNFFAKGIDVSHYQGTVDWAKVQQAGVHFAFIKATEGTTLADAFFKKNWKGSRAAGIRRGAYHFFKPGPNGGDQAAFFLQKLGKLQNGDLPPMVDLETFSSNDPQNPPWNSANAGSNVSQIQDFLKEVEDALGLKAILYSSASFFQEMLGGTQQFSNYPFWVAKYPAGNQPISLQDPVPSAEPTVLPAGVTQWSFWQYTGQGTIPGIFDPQNPVDLDIFHGTPGQFQKFPS